MRGELIVYWLAWLNTICWGICFWWMHRISSRQHALMIQFKEQGVRIEVISRVEHDMMKEVHPQVSEIKEGVAEVVEVARDLPRKNSPGKSGESE